MRFLVVGAGALGGYFGGRLMQAGEDVTFLVRPRRAAQLAKTGLVIKSPFGNLELPSPPVVLTQDIQAPYDVVIVGCKAYDLAGTMASFAAAVGPETAVLPVLNGLRHLDELTQRFGRERVLGGLCMISAVLDDEGRVMHVNDMHGLVYGELDGNRSPRIDAIQKSFASANFDAVASDNILQAMWEKWMFIASAAGMTCLMRASIGDIVAGGGNDLATALVDECAAVASRNGFTPSPASIQRARTALTTAGSPITASMFKDMERGAPIEADHIIGDLIQRAGDAVGPLSLLRVVYAHLKAYEARRAREAKAT